MTVPLRAVLVEDSPTQAQAIRRMLEADGDIVVVARAEDATTAIAEVARHRPDVVTMDLDVPKGGGQHAIEQIMAQTPTPILVLSGIIDSDAEPHAIRALAAGAVDALPKPRTWTSDGAAELRRHVRRVCGVPVIRRRQRTSVRAGRIRNTSGAVVAVAASTGGPAALAAVLRGLHGLPAPILVVQHIHPSFSGSFAAWLGGATGIPTALAEHGQEAVAGRAYVGPGDLHLRLGPKRTLLLSPDPPTLHRPSADVLFASVAEHAGAAGVGVVLTGMGDDGSDGLLALRRAGGRALAQDEGSSTVFGMPRAAQAAGAAHQMLPLEDISRAVRRAVEEAV